MLQGLDDIDWAALTHAFGPATEVPDLLKVASKGDELERQEAYEELGQNLWHQGAVYEATAPAVPFLYQLLAEAPRAEERETIVALLAEIARGKAAKAELAGAAHEAVRKGLATALPFLRDPHPGVRLQTALLCASVPEAAAESRGHLQRALERERGLQVRAGIGLALAALGTWAEEAFDSEDDDLPLERLAALAQQTARTRSATADFFRVLSDIADGSFDESLLDELDLA